MSKSGRWVVGMAEDERVSLAISGNVVVCPPLRRLQGMRQNAANQRRGIITHYSRASRLRFRTCIERCAEPGVLFVTLTFDRDIGSPQRAKECMRAWLKRVRRRWPRAWAFWKLEPTERGWPHLHLLLGGVGIMPYQYWSAAWAAIYGGGAAAAKNGADFKPIRSCAAAHYVAKYVGKPAGEGKWKRPGRYWGRERVPLAAWRNVFLDRLAACWLRKRFDWSPDASEWKVHTFGRAQWFRGARAVLKEAANPARLADRDLIEFAASFDSADWVRDRAREVFGRFTIGHRVRRTESELHRGGVALNPEAADRWDADLW